MIQNLKKPTTKKKESLRKKRLNKLMRVGDDVREVCLKSYFHLCKEKAARKFIDWRIEQAKLIQDKSLKRALRLRRLSNFDKFNKEESIFKLFKLYESDFEGAKSELMRMELELQAERKVATWATMYDLIVDSHASALYLQAFLDRKAT